MPKKLKLKAITFDLDQTLIDFMDFKRRSTDAAAKAMLKAGFKAPVKRIGKTLFDFYLDYGLESDDVLTKFLHHHEQYNEKILAAGINAYLKTKYTVLKSYPKVRPILNQLRKNGYKLAIITDAPRLKAFMRLDEMKITDLFDVVVGYEDTNRHKPSKLPFRKALKLLNVKPSEALHVGDWKERDILGAKNMGMLSCFARYGAEQKNKKIWADYYIDKFEDIIKIVKIIEEIR